VPSFNDLIEHMQLYNLKSKGGLSDAEEKFVEERLIFLRIRMLDIPPCTPPPPPLTLAERVEQLQKESQAVKAENEQLIEQPRNRLTQEDVVVRAKVKARTESEMEKQQREKQEKLEVEWSNWRYE
jgi:hypothetical protein